MKKQSCFVVLMFLLIALISSCDERGESSLGNTPKEMIGDEITTKSSSSRESTFDRYRVPDYTFDAVGLLTPIISSEDRFYYAEMPFKLDEYPMLVIPEIHGYYSAYTEPNDNYDKNYICEYGRTLGISVGYIRNNILALKFTYIPPELPAGELILHTIVKCNNDVLDRYILIKNFSGTYAYGMLNGNENFSNGEIYKFNPGGKKDVPEEFRYEKGFAIVYCN